MTDAAKFEAAIRENPVDAFKREVYADWLEEQGDHVRAAFLRGNQFCVRCVAEGRLWLGVLTWRPGVQTWVCGVCEPPAEAFSATERGRSADDDEAARRQERAFEQAAESLAAFGRAAEIAGMFVLPGTDPIRTYPTEFAARLTIDATDPAEIRFGIANAEGIPPEVTDL